MMERIPIKYKRIVIWDLTLNYTCPMTNEIVNVPVTYSDFDYGEEKCDYCGDHGFLTLKLGVCPSCKKHHDHITIDSW
jgi:hypothetical protein